MHTLADLGNTEQNVAESIKNTICNRVARSLLNIGDQAESCAQLFYMTVMSVSHTHLFISNNIHFSMFITSCVGYDYSGLRERNSG